MKKDFIDFYALDTIMKKLDSIFDDNVVTRTIVEMGWTFITSEYGYAYTPPAQTFHIYTDDFTGTIVTSMSFPQTTQVYICRVKYMKNRIKDRFYITHDSYFLRPELHGIATQTMKITDISLDLLFLNDNAGW